MREDMRVVDLANVGPATRRHAGELDMAGDVEIGIDPAGQVAFQNLDVIAVEHQLEVGRAHSLDDPAGHLCMVQEIARRVILVQRLDQDGAPARCRCAPAPSGAHDSPLAFSSSTPIWVSCAVVAAVPATVEFAFCIAP